MEVELSKSVADRLENTKLLFLDTAPVIYYVEKNALYINAVRAVFNWIDEGRITVITSPITLSECLVHPYRRDLKQLQQDFIDLIVYGENTIFKPIDHIVSQKAAQLRANYNLCLADALQLATALTAKCDSFLTNDVDIKRITELDVIVLNEIQAM